MIASEVTVMVFVFITTDTNFLKKFPSILTFFILVKRNRYDLPRSQILKEVFIYIRKVEDSSLLS